MSQYRVTFVDRLSGKSATKTYKDRRVATDMYNFIVSDMSPYLYAVIGEVRSDKFGNKMFHPFASLQSSVSSSLPGAAH